MVYNLFTAWNKLGIRNEIAVHMHVIRTVIRLTVGAPNNTKCFNSSFQGNPTNQQVIFDNNIVNYINYILRSGNWKDCEDPQVRVDSRDICLQ